MVLSASEVVQGIGFRALNQEGFASSKVRCTSVAAKCCSAATALMGFPQAEFVTLPINIRRVSWLYPQFQSEET